MKPVIASFKLKYKFLIFFATVFSVSLLALVLINIRFFKNDKIAYVFSSIIDSSQTATLILKAEIASQKPLFEIIVKSFDFQNKRFFLDKISTLEITDSVQYLQIEEDQKNKSIVLDSIGKLDPALKILLQKEVLESETSVVFFPEQKERYAIQRKVHIAGLGSEKYKVTIVLKRNPFNEIINQPKFYDLFLVSKSGIISQQPDQISEKNYNIIFKQFFKDKKNSLSTSAVTREITVGQTNYMLTWSPLGYGDLGFISVLKSDKALQAVTKAIQTSIAIFLLLLGIGLIIVMFLVGNLTKSLELLSSLMLKFSGGDMDVKANIKTSDEVGLLARVFNEMTTKIKTLLDETKHKARMESELETARTVQKRLIPSKNDFGNELGQICGHYEPASECGGDWWFYFTEENYFYFIIADATGHGVPAALITAALRAAVAAQSGHDKSKLSDYVSTINRVISDSADGAINATFFIGRYHQKNSEIEYCNVSHCAPMVIRKSSGEIEFLDEISGKRLGESHTAEYKSFVFKLEPSDVIFAYTDGLSEFSNDKNKMYGERRILKGLSKYWESGASLKQYRILLLKEFYDFKKDIPLDDDLTFLFFQGK
jgi:sigma-B regulation protein RsbU (phosphoserine phosphatase)